MRNATLQGKSDMGNLNIRLDERTVTSAATLKRRSLSCTKLLLFAASAFYAINCALAASATIGGIKYSYAINSYWYDGETGEEYEGSTPSSRVPRVRRASFPPSRCPARSAP